MNKESEEIFNRIIDKGSQMTDFDKSILDKLSNNEDIDLSDFRKKEIVFNYLNSFKIEDGVIYDDGDSPILYIAKSEEFEYEKINEDKKPTILYIGNLITIELFEKHNIELNTAIKIVVDIYKTFYNNNKYDDILIKKYYYPFMFNEQGHLLFKYL